MDLVGAISRSCGLTIFDSILNGDKPLGTKAYL